MSNRVAGIILAAGNSSRFGAIKQLLPWRNNKNLINSVIETATLAGLNPVIVVLGSNAKQIRVSLDDSQAQIVDNPDWETGQSTSLKAGLRAIEIVVCGAVFLLADQPQLSVNLVRAVAEEGKQTGKVIVPVINDRRANPVYFPAACFYLFESLRGDIGGRQIVSGCPHTTIPWLDEWMAMDVDTPENYEELCDHFGVEK